MYPRALAALLVALVTASPALAAPPPALHDIRSALARYDLEDGGTLRVLEQIHARVPRATGLTLEELRFLRAAVAADLSFIAAVRDDDALLEAVAAAVGQSSEGLAPFLDAELGRARGTYRAPAHAVRNALGQLRAGARDIAALPAGTHGELLRLLAMRRALSADVDPVTALGPFGTDPCSAPGPSCTALFHELDARTRRAASALSRGAEAVRRLRQAQQYGDPLSSALRPELEHVLAQLRGVELRPVPRIAVDAGLAVAPDAQPLVADLVLIVGPGQVQYGFAPRVRLDADGALERFTPHTPALPELVALPLPTSFRPFMSPLPEATELIEGAMKDNPELTIAVGSRGDAKAHLLGRVLLSLRRAGNGRAWLLARDERGFARATAVQLVSKRESDDADNDEAPVHVRVRLGGYSLHVGDDYEDIPRVRDEEGLHFDVDTLQSRLSAQRQVVKADVSFMSDVASQNLTSAVFGIAGRSQELRLIFP